MKDRKPKYPGRIKLIPVPGQPGVYDMERADEATDQGTPLNTLTFLTDEVADFISETHANAIVDTPNQAFGLVAKPALVREIILTKDGWEENGIQIASIPGVLADETKQVIQIIPSSESQVEFDEALIFGVQQGEGTITFTYRGSVPEKDIKVYAAIYSTHFIEE